MINIEKNCKSKLAIIETILLGKSNKNTSAQTNLYLHF